MKFKKSLIAGAAAVALVASLSMSAYAANNNSFTIYNSTNKTMFITGLGVSWDLNQCGKKGQLKACVDISPQASLPNPITILPNSSKVINLSPIKEVLVRRMAHHLNSIVLLISWVPRFRGGRRSLHDAPDGRIKTPVA